MADLRYTVVCAREPRQLRRLLRGVRTDWTFLVFGCSEDQAIFTEGDAIANLSALLPSDANWVVPFRTEIARDVERSLQDVTLVAERGERFLLLLLRPRRPAKKRKHGRVVDAFACDADFLRHVLETDELTLETLCFHATVRAVENTNLELRIAAGQLPYRVPPETRSAGTASLRVVIPHRGDESHLANCLRRMRTACAGLERCTVHVAIDQEMTPELHRLVREHPEVRFCRVAPPQSGPYVPRHLLGTGAEEDFVVFQDSDDVPTHDRFRLLQQEIEQRGCDVAGSHILDIDEGRQLVRPCRYPLDAVKPLRREPQNTLFHPSMMLRTTALRSAGGLSTVRRFASDREFNLRAYFCQLRLRNVDRFLYLRRIRGDSLVHSSSTGMRSPARLELHEQWHADFARIQSGGMSLDDSSLAPSHLDPMPELLPVEEARGDDG